jgi:hypothetical protein
MVFSLGVKAIIQKTLAHQLFFRIENKDFYQLHIGMGETLL